MQIAEIVITLNPNLFFDTAIGSPGHLLWENVASVSGAGSTGFSGFSATGAALDGGTVLTLTFNNFTAGKTYQHVGDVDENVTLQNCAGLAPLQLSVCLALNSFASSNASLVTGAEFAGSTIQITLGGQGLNAPAVLTGTFVETGVLTAVAEWRGDVDTVNAVPEPATFALCGVVLAGLGLLRRRR